MHSRFPLWCLLALFAVLSAPLAADVKTFKGEVVDRACALDKGAASRGESHAACAMTCAKNGDAMVFVTDDAVYVVEGSYTADRNAKLLDFIGKKVEAKGTLTDRDGAVFINIAAMMVQK